MLVLGAGALSMVGVGFFGGVRFGDFFRFLSVFFSADFPGFLGFVFFNSHFFLRFFASVRKWSKTVFESRWTMNHGNK